MKKIITLFMATVVAMSMMALPKSPVFAGKKVVPAEVEKLSVENPLKAKVQDITKKELMTREFVRPEVVVKKAPANQPTLKKAAAEGETINMPMDFYVGPEYYDETGDWYIALGNDDWWTAKLDWYAPRGENNEGYLGTFTTEDFDFSYSYMVDPDYNYVDYEEITMTITKEAVSEYVNLIALTATILGSDGNTYVLTASKEVLTPKETIELAIDDATLAWDADEMVSVLTAKNENLELSLTYGAPWATGPFSMLDLFPEESSVKYNGAELELSTLDMLVAAVKNEAGQVGYQVELSMISTEPIQYNVSLFAPLYATDTVELEFNNLTVDESGAADWGWIFCNANTSEWTLNAGIGAWEMEEGTYVGEEYVMFYLTNELTGHFTEQVYAELVVTNDPEYGWVLDIESFCTDNKVYKVNMKKLVPTATDTVEIKFDKTSNAAFYPWLGNDLLLANYNEQYYAGIDVVGVELGSTFTMDDLDLDYTLIFSDYANRVMVEMAEVEGTIYQVGDTTIIEAEVMGYDGVLYDVELWHCVPTPTETVKVDIQAEFENTIATDGFYMLSGYNAENTLYITLAPVTDEAVEGTFINDGVFSRFGAEGGRYDFYCDYTAVYKNVNGEAVPYSVEKCDLTVTVDDAGNVTAVATLIAADAVQYEVTMTAAYNEHMPYDAEEGAIDRTYTAEDEVMIEVYEGNIVYFEVMAADGSDICSLYMFPEEIDDDITLQPGTYAINDTEDYFTVLASEGVVGSSVYPSFYANMTEDGYLLTPLYFFVDGTVTVEKVNGKLKLEVNALNSYDVPIHIVFDAGTTTDVEHIAAENGNVEKKIVNGQLYIIRNGKAYNAIGAQVK